MQYEIPNTPEQAKLRYDLTWKLSSKEIYSYMKQYGILSLVLIIGSIVISLNNALGVFILLFALMASLNFILFVLKYRTAKKKYYKQVNEMITLQKQQTVFNQILVFGDDTFAYNDSLIDTKIKWSVFKHYTVIDDILFFGYTSDLQYNYSIHRADIGETEFQKVLAFVKQKIDTSND